MFGGGFWGYLLKLAVLHCLRTVPVNCRCQNSSLSHVPGLCVTRLDQVFAADPNPRAIGTALDAEACDRPTEIILPRLVGDVVAHLGIFATALGSTHDSNLESRTNDPFSKRTSSANRATTRRWEFSCTIVSSPKNTTNRTGLSQAQPIPEILLCYLPLGAPVHPSTPRRPRTFHRRAART